MLLPYLNAPEQSTEMLSQFGGYNHRLSINEGEFFDMQNMSAKDFPLAATRDPRGTVDIGGSYFVENAQGIAAENKLIIPYIGKGDIGVEIQEDVPATGITPITDGVTFEGEDGRYTKICDFRNDPIINEIKDGFPKTGLIRFNQSADGKIKKHTSGKTPVIKSDGLYIKWPHEKIDKGTFWARVLFSVCYRHERDGVWWKEHSDRLIVSAEDNEYLSNLTVRNALRGKDYFVFVNQNEWKKVKILAIEKLGKAMFSNWGTSEYNNGLAILRKGDWAITLSMPDGVSTIEESYIKVNDEFIIAATDPLTEEIAAREDEETTLRKLNPPTEVSVSAATPTHLQALLGQTVNFSGNDIYISDIDTTDGKYKIYLDRPHGAIAKDSTLEGERLFLCELDPATGEAITSDIFAAAAGEHKLIEMGAKLVIFPEKVVVNTHKKNADGQFNDIQMIEFTNTMRGKGSYAYRLCNIDGKFYTSGKDSDIAPESPSDGAVWIDTSQEPPVLKVWSSQTSQWAVTQPYCQIYSQKLSELWKVGDAIELEFGEEGGDKYMAPQKEQKYFVISAVGKDENDIPFIRIPLAVKTVSECKPSLDTDSISIRRTIPDMDFIIENENRLWGCKYGLVDGEMINEIFACKLGDPTNWHHFTNTAIDSYYVTLGADGNFTGAISYGRSPKTPVFFRENCMHRIYGNFPANFSAETYDCHGVEAGSDKSLAVMNDVLFYKSPVGIMAYTGATPVNISECFGNVKYKNAIACALGNKMFVSMKDSKGERVLFSFDDSSKLWHKEDSLDIKDFTVYGGEIYALTEENRIISMSGVNGKIEDDFEWFLESGKIGFMTPYRKRISKINIRLLMELNAMVSLSIQYDSSGHFEHISNIRPSGKVKSISIPVMPRRCDHFALRIEGVGDCKILSITKFTEGGSDIE